MYRPLCMPYTTPYTLSSFRTSSIHEEKNSITVEGTGKVKAIPDIAVISMGIITKDKNLNKTQEENAQISNQVIQGLLTQGILPKDIQTVIYKVEQEYDYIEGERIFKGYKVSNYLSVIIKDIKKTGIIIDSVIEKGVNDIRDIRFDVSDLSLYYRKALIEAVKNAVTKAKDIGKTLGVWVNNVPTEIIEENYNSKPHNEIPVYRSPEEVTPIQPGQMEISSTIKAEFKY